MKYPRCSPVILCILFLSIFLLNSCSKQKNSVLTRAEEYQKRAEEHQISLPAVSNFRLELHDRVPVFYLSEHGQYFYDHQAVSRSEIRNSLKKYFFRYGLQAGIAVCIDEKAMCQDLNVILSEVKGLGGSLVWFSALKRGNLLFQPARIIPGDDIEIDSSISISISGSSIEIEGKTVQSDQVSEYINKSSSIAIIIRFSPKTPIKEFYKVLDSIAKDKPENVIVWLDVDMEKYRRGS